MITPSEVEIKNEVVVPHIYSHCMYMHKTMLGYLDADHNHMRLLSI